MESFNGWTKKNCLLLNTIKTKELVVDFRRSKTPYQSVSIDRGEIETVQTCKYMGVVLDNKLQWSANIEAVYRRDHSCLFFLRLSGAVLNWFRSYLEGRSYFVTIRSRAATDQKTPGSDRFVDQSHGSDHFSDQQKKKKDKTNKHKFGLFVY